MSWTTDGYIALVTLINYQSYRHIEAPGWTLGWHWAKNEVIWEMSGAQAAMQGDCSKFEGPIPHCCKRDPVIVDLLPDAPYNLQMANCCKGGVLTSFAQDHQNSIASFQVTVGLSGNSNTTVHLPRNYTLGLPGPGYTCDPAKAVSSSLFPTPDGRRHTQALMTWNVTCKYSQFLAQRAPSCCVSFSSFYNDTIIPCQTCACNCKYNITQPTEKVRPMSCVDPYVTGYSTGLTSQTPEVYCTQDMCPVKVHWHVKANYYNYWRAKITIINRSLLKNFTQWNLEIQHPNLNNLTTAFSFLYKGVSSYNLINDTGMFWGIKFYNDMLLTAGPNGYVQSEVLFKKDPTMFSFKQGWAFPHRVYFNGDDCVLPPPDAYPWMPNKGTARNAMSAFMTAAVAIAYIANML
ncbi:hypothetical protein O6H91_Y283400 [Diphasiastrum complanatum]|nr:hypothetical protein O6H91_Y283400 [Diphasiastrum complanatum]